MPSEEILEGLLFLLVGLFCFGACLKVGCYWGICKRREERHEEIHDVEHSESTGLLEDSKIDIPKYDTISFVAGPDFITSDKECGVCLEKYYQGDSMQLLTCGHFYHSSCYEQWKKKKGSKTTCPECRKPV